MNLCVESKGEKIEEGYAKIPVLGGLNYYSTVSEVSSLCTLFIEHVFVSN